MGVYTTMRASGMSATARLVDRRRLEWCVRMVGRLRVLTVVLVVAGAVLAGCSLAPARRAGPPAPSPGGPPSVASLCGPRVPGAEKPPDAWVRFDVTARQIEVIDRRMIHPGNSGLSARQILDRFLGRAP